MKNGSLDLAFNFLVRIFLYYVKHLEDLGDFYCLWSFGILLLVLLVFILHFLFIWLSWRLCFRNSQIWEPDLHFQFGGKFMDEFKDNPRKTIEFWENGLICGAFLNVVLKYDIDYFAICKTKCHIVMQRIQTTFKIFTFFHVLCYFFQNSDHLVHSYSIMHKKPGIKSISIQLYSRKRFH